MSGEVAVNAESGEVFRKGVGCANSQSEAVEGALTLEIGANKVG